MVVTAEASDRVVNGAGTSTSGSIRPYRYRSIGPPNGGAGVGLGRQGPAGETLPPGRRNTEAD